VEFEGTKTFSWMQWARQNYGTGVNVGIEKNTAVDLGDGVRVESTKVVYGNGISTPAYYPSVTESPVAGSLYLRRRKGGLADSKITVTVNLNTPVCPEFSIYDIDGYYGRYEQVTVTGYCGNGSGGAVIPMLSYGGNPALSYYRILGNRATAIERSSVASANKDGQLNVSFQGGITQIVIEFAITGQPQVTSTHDLIISPVRLRQVPPQPPVNEDGLSFVKDINRREITTCEPVEYSFCIKNVNCVSKYVNFRDTLPDDLTWAGEIGFSDVDAAEHSHVKIKNNKGTKYLGIDSLYVPGAGERRVTATALIDKNAIAEGDSRTFDNHAWIEYRQIVDNDLLDRTQKSVDLETLEEETRFTAEGKERLGILSSSVVTSVNRYSAAGIVTVTLTVDNPNTDAIPGFYLDVSFDAKFTYVVSSFSSTNVSPSPMVVSFDDSHLSIGGSADGLQGFEIPNGKSIYTFQLQAPSFTDLEKETDANGDPTGNIMQLKLEYIFTANADPCTIVGDMSGVREIPYNASRQSIMINKHVTAKTK
jgi:hypothetical protein